MRISDWSSDVCSSDLPCAAPAAATPAIRLAVETIPSLAPRIAARSQPTRWAAWVSWCMVRRCPFPILQLQSRPRPARLHQPSTARQGQIGVAHVRSEEHTSELQSLMRISYAVFCLKNKITHPKITRSFEYRTVRHRDST